MTTETLLARATMMYQSPRLYRSLNEHAEARELTSYATMRTAQTALTKYGSHGGSIAFIVRSDGRIVVFIVNPKDLTTALHGTPFVCWS